MRLTLITAVAILTGGMGLAFAGEAAPGAAVTEPEGVLEVFMRWAFHPFVVVHLGSFLVTQFLKFPLCQWLPVAIFNRLSPTPNVNGICPRTRKILTAALAFSIAALATVFFWPADFYRGHYGVAQLAVINGVFSPIIVALFFALADRVPFLQPVAAFLGAREVDPEHPPLKRAFLGKRAVDPPP